MIASSPVRKAWSNYLPTVLDVSSRHADPARASIASLQPTAALSLPLAPLARDSLGSLAVKMALLAWLLICTSELLNCAASDAQAFRDRLRDLSEVRQEQSTLKSELQVAAHSPAAAFGGRQLLARMHTREGNLSISLFFTAPQGIAHCVRLKSTQAVHRHVCFVHRSAPLFTPASTHDERSCNHSGLDVFFSL
eukprot:3247515-Pleurochrysis_carterae.AAC.6